MKNQLELLGTEVVKANDEYYAAAKRFLDISEKMRKAMREEKKYCIVVDGRLLRWADGVIHVD